MTPALLAAGIIGACVFGAMLAVWLLIPTKRERDDRARLDAMTARWLQ